MPMNILVLHGPNLNLLGERPGDEPGRSLEELNRLLKEKALVLGLELRIVQSNHEGVLVDALHADRKWAEGVVVSPGALARSGYVLREALRAVGKPAIEVHLDEYRNEEGKRLKSVFKDICAGRVFGKGFDSYVTALQRFVTGELDGGKARRAEVERAPRRTLGPKPSKPAAAPARPAGAPGVRVQEKSIGRAPRPEPKPRKSIGTVARATEAPRAAEKSLGRRDKDADAGVLTREQVRQKIADRLSGKLTPADLASWARTQWLEVQRGAPTERGQREALEDALQQLVVSTQPRSRATDAQLVDLMARLDR